MNSGAVANFCAGEGVTEDVVLGAARAMADKLKHAGYEYINLDW